jgi:hypothetical protein
VTDVCAIDIETDGLHHGRRAWEVAIIRRFTGEFARTITWHRFIDIDLSTADVAGLRIGGFYDRHPYGRYLSGSNLPPTAPDRSRFESGYPDVVTRTRAAQEIARLTHGATIVGAIPSFDTETLTQLLLSEGVIPAWHYRLRCVETLAAGHFGHDLGGLKKCADALGIEPWDEHTALGDANAALQIYDACINSENAA